MNNAFDLGLLVGRFQHCHRGHDFVIETAARFCGRVLILVGSAQDVGSIKNPFDVGTRITMLRECYPDEKRFLIHALPDMTSSGDITPAWGKFVLQHAKQYANKTPELMIYGNEDSRSGWFDKADIKDMCEVIIPRSKTNISATIIREYLLRGDDEHYRDLWHENTNPRIHQHYEFLRQQLLQAPGYRDIVHKLSHYNESWSDKSFGWLSDALKSG